MLSTLSHAAHSWSRQVKPQSLRFENDDIALVFDTSNVHNDLSLHISMQKYRLSNSIEMDCIS